MVTMHAWMHACTHSSVRRYVLYIHVHTYVLVCMPIIMSTDIAYIDHHTLYVIIVTHASMASACHCTAKRMQNLPWCQYLPAPGCRLAAAMKLQRLAALSVQRAGILHIQRKIRHGSRPFDLILFGHVIISVVLRILALRTYHITRLRSHRDCMRVLLNARACT